MSVFSVVLLTLSSTLVPLISGETLIANETHGETLTCKGGEDCNVVCIAVDYIGYCSADTIQCPLDDSLCYVSCIGFSACNTATIEWGPVGTNTLIFDGEWSLNRVNFPEPPPNEPLAITCDDDYECHAATMFCPENADCNIECSGDHSCYWNNITCPVHGDCNIVCSNQAACWGSKVICPTDGDCSVSCSGADGNACSFMDVTWSPLPHRNNLVCAQGSCGTLSLPPTVSPTATPSEDPTPAPTRDPTTPRPTLGAVTTGDPTTSAPTLESQKVEDQTTVSPTKSPLESEMETEETPSSGLSTEMWVFAVLGALVVLAICGVLVWWQFWKKRIDVEGSKTDNAIGGDQTRVQLTTSRLPPTNKLPTNKLPTNGATDLDTAADLNLPDSPQYAPHVVVVGEPNDDTDENDALYGNGPGAEMAAVTNHGGDESSSDELYHVAETRG